MSITVNASILCLVMYLFILYSNSNILLLLFELMSNSMESFSIISISTMQTGSVNSRSFH